MGQAKQRGSFEERKALAIAKLPPPEPVVIQPEKIEQEADADGFYKDLRFSESCALFTVLAAALQRPRRKRW